MIKLHRLVIVFLLIQASNSFAQTTNKITGNVLNSEGKAIEFVTVSLLNKTDSSLIKSTITDNFGKYNFEVSHSGEYIIIYTFVGYEKLFSEKISFAIGNDYTVKVVILKPMQTKLNVLTVTSKKPMIEVKADKTIFNIESSINATGTDAFELLRKSPGVQIDNNDNIIMKGKTGVRIYIDGKISQLDSKDLAAFLKGINSADIEAIEMISNPSAKYDASGNAGIINIRLKKNKKFGTNGNLSTGFEQGIHAKENGSVGINYRDKKINIFGNFGGNLSVSQYRMKLFRIQKDTIYDLVSTNKHDNKYANIKTGIDYFVNNKNTIGVMFTTNISNGNETSLGITPIYFNPTGEFVKKLQADSRGKGKSTNTNFNLNYKYADTSGREINIDADYGSFKKNGTSYQPNIYTDLNDLLINSVVNRNSTPLNIDIYTAKLDAEQRLGKGKIGYGGKFSLVTTDNTFDFYNDDVNGLPIKLLSKSNYFTYKENVNALYTNFQRPLNLKWNIQIGLRMEHTKSEGVLTRADSIVQADNTVKKSYTDFFPSGALTYNINKKHSLNLTFSRRIDRPSYQDLNPFENKLDELTYQKGNAFLRPQYSNTLELTHTFMGFINTTLGYSHVHDYATEVTDTTGNATYVQQQNLATQQLYTFSIGAPTPIKKWWVGYVNIWYNYQIFDGVIGGKIYKQKLPLYGAYLQQSFTVGKDYTAEISGWYNGPSIWGATWKVKPQGSMDAGIQKLLFKKSATIKLSVTDIFFTAPWKSINVFGGFYVKGSGDWESRSVRLNFNWRFGSKQINASRERKTGLENENKRIKGTGN